MTDCKLPNYVENEEDAKEMFGTAEEDKPRGWKRASEEELNSSPKKMATSPMTKEQPSPMAKELGKLALSEEPFTCCVCKKTSYQDPDLVFDHCQECKRMICEGCEEVRLCGQCEGMYCIGCKHNCQRMGEREMDEVIVTWHPCEQMELGDLPKAAESNEAATEVSIVTEMNGASEATPNEATPNESTPSEVTPSEAIPSEATPNEATPSEATPSEATPNEATLSEAIPSETMRMPCEQKKLGCNICQNPFDRIDKLEWCAGCREVVCGKCLPKANGQQCSKCNVYFFPPCNQKLLCDLQSDHCLWCCMCEPKSSTAMHDVDVANLRLWLQQDTLLCNYLRDISNGLQKSSNKFLDDHYPHPPTVDVKQILVVQKQEWMNNHWINLKRKEPASFHNNAWCCPYPTMCKNPLYVDEEKEIHLTTWSTGADIKTVPILKSPILKSPDDALVACNRIQYRSSTLREYNILLTMDEFHNLFTRPMESPCLIELHSPFRPPQNVAEITATPDPLGSIDETSFAPGTFADSCCESKVMHLSDDDESTHVEEDRICSPGIHYFKSMMQPSLPDLAAKMILLATPMTPVQTQLNRQMGHDLSDDDESTCCHCKTLVDGTKKCIQCKQPLCVSCDHSCGQCSRDFCARAECEAPGYSCTQCDKWICDQDVCQKTKCESNHCKECCNALKHM